MIDGQDIPEVTLRSVQPQVTMIPQDPLLFHRTVFDKGKVIEDGFHEERLSWRGHYAHMWNMQADGFMALQQGKK